MSPFGSWSAESSQEPAAWRERTGSLGAWPRSSRRIGGRLAVSEASRRLHVAYATHRASMRMIAGTLIRIPEFELKIELAHHLYHHGDAAQALRGRLSELRASAATLDAPPTPGLRLVVDEALLARDSAEVVVALHGVLARRLLAFERQYVKDTDGLVDQPSVRILGRTIADLEAMVRWSDLVQQRFVDGGYAESALHAWRDHLDSVLEGLGGLDGELASARPLPPLRQADGPYRRPIQCARDDRFVTFAHTRRYDIDEHCIPAGQRMDGYGADRLEIIRVQRDELDAIETFANVLFDLEDAPFEFEMALARFIWDEARHAETGQQLLEHLGYDAFAIPCGIIGINVRSPLPPVLAFAQINTFGELNQVASLRRFAQRAYAEDDFESGRCFDFVHADEMLHLRTGRAWLRRFAAESGSTLAALCEEARKRAVQRLVEEGVIGEDYALDLSPADLAELLGE